ncbi:MAG: universal stress protein, partial [Actinomycetales bacterium]
MTSTSWWIDRIVVGVDGSESARKAAQWAAQEASLRKAGLTLVSALLPPVAASGF